jgi:hypothetical protein
MGKGPEFFKVTESMKLAPDKPPPRDGIARANERYQRLAAS